MKQIERNDQTHVKMVILGWWTDSNFYFLLSFALYLSNSLQNNIVSYNKQEKTD